MSLRQKQEKQQEQTLSLRERMALFQASPSVRQASGKGSAACKKKKGGAERNTSSLRVETEIKDSKTFSPSTPSNAHINETPVSTPCPAPSDTCHSQELVSFLLPSYCDSLFNSLRTLKDERLLLDCSLQLLGDAYKAHGLVLAAISQKAEKWLGSQIREVNLNNEEGYEGHITYTGLNAVLNFAYYGEADLSYTEARDLEEILVACRCLGVDRLASVFKGEAPSTERTEREKSLQVIRTLWKKCVGCDVVMEVESGERFPGNHGFLDWICLTILNDKNSVLLSIIEPLIVTIIAHCTYSMYKHKHVCPMILARIFH